MKKEKLALIREAEASIGFARFKVNSKSSEEELDEVLGFIRSISVDLQEHILPKIEKFYSDEDR